MWFYFTPQLLVVLKEQASLFQGQKGHPDVERSLWSHSFSSTILQTETVPGLWDWISCEPVLSLLWLTHLHVFNSLIMNLNCLGVKFLQILFCNGAIIFFHYKVMLCWGGGVLTRSHTLTALFTPCSPSDWSVFASRPPKTKPCLPTTLMH